MQTRLRPEIPLKATPLTPSKVLGIALVISALVGFSSKAIFDKRNEKLVFDKVGEVNLAGGQKDALMLMAKIDHKKIGASDLSTLEKLLNDDDENVRDAAYNTAAMLAKTEFRQEALSFLDKVPSDRSERIRSRNVWLRFVARTEDWRKLAQEGLKSDVQSIREDSKLALENDPNNKKTE